MLTWKPSFVFGNFFLLLIERFMILMSLFDVMSNQFKPILIASKYEQVVELKANLHTLFLSLAIST